MIRFRKINIPNRAVRSQHGFTILELMVVLAIASTVLILAMPSVYRLLPGATQKETTADLLNALRHTRSSALRTGRIHSLIFDLQTNSYVAVDGNRWLDKRILQGRLPAKLGLSVRIAERDLGADKKARFRFFPDGAASGGRVMLVWPGQDRMEHLRVNWLTGLVEVLSDLEVEP